MAAILSGFAIQNQLKLNFGEHYTDDLAGLAVYTNAENSFLMRIAWLDSTGKVHEGYNALMECQPRFGPAAADDSYHRLEWRVDGNGVTYEWSRLSRDCAIARISASGQTKIVLKFGPAWSGSKPTFNRRYQLMWADAGAFQIDIGCEGDEQLSAEAEEHSLNIERRFTLGPESALFIRFGDLPKTKWPMRSEGFTVYQPFTTVQHNAPVPDLGAIIDKARKAYERSAPRAEGDWGDFVSPIVNQLGHSRVLSCETSRLAHTVSRRWCLPDGQVLFCWDSFFNGLLSSIADPEAGRQTVRAILAAETPEGFVPNFFGRTWGVSADRSQPPVGALCVWKMYQRDPDKEFLQEVYPKLLRWHRWWFSTRPNGKPVRDGNRDGLLEWGTETGDLQNAKYESGLDDSPMFDSGKMFGPNMDLNATDLNALYAMDAEYLAKIAEAIGDKNDASALSKERDAMAQRLNQSLWNETAGTYCYRDWNQQFVSRLSPLNFYPMICGAPSHEQAPKMLALLFDSNRFNGEFVCPTISRDDPAFPKQGYWRGTIWGPTNYLLYQGLRRYASDKQRGEYARKSVALFMKNWNADGTCHENFNAMTGEGRSDPHYTWGSLLCLIGLEELCDVEPDGRLRLNGNAGVHARIHNLRLKGKLYDLVIEPGNAQLLRGKKIVATAKGEVIHLALD